MILGAGFFVGLLTYGFRERILGFFQNIKIYTSILSAFQNVHAATRRGPSSSHLRQQDQYFLWVSLPFFLHPSWGWWEGNLCELSVRLVNTPGVKLDSPFWWRRMPWVGVSKNIVEASCQVSYHSTYPSKVRNTSWLCWNINEVICLNHLSDLGKIWKTNKDVL